MNEKIMNYKLDGSRVFFTSDTHFNHTNIIGSKNPTDKFWCLLEPYPFSVSKVNILISILMTIIWNLLFIFSLGLFWNWNISKYEECLCYFIIILTVSFVFLFFFL